MAFSLIENQEDYPLFKITANNEGGGFGAVVPMPFVTDRPELAVAVGNWMSKYSFMTTRAIWAEIALDNVGIDKAPDPGAEAKDAFFKVRIVPAGMTQADAFTVTVPIPRMAVNSVDDVEEAGQELAALYEADPGIATATFIPQRAGR